MKCFHLLASNNCLWLFSSTGKRNKLAWNRFWFDITNSEKVFRNVLGLREPETYAFQLFFLWSGNCVYCARISCNSWVVPTKRDLMANVGVSLVPKCPTHFTVGRRPTQTDVILTTRGPTLKPTEQLWRIFFCLTTSTFPSHWKCA